MKVSNRLKFMDCLWIICLRKNHFMNIKKRSVKPWRFNIYSPLTLLAQAGVLLYYLIHIVRFYVHVAVFVMVA